MSEMKFRPYFLFNWQMRNTKIKKNLRNIMDMLTYYGNIKQLKYKM